MDSYDGTNMDLGKSNLPLSQSTFFPAHNIQHNVIVTGEILHTMRSSKVLLAL